MKFAIMANNTPSFIKPLAESLDKRIKSLGHTSKVFYNGLHYLESFSSLSRVYARNIVKKIINIVYKRNYKIYPLDIINTTNSLKDYDCMIVVVNLPGVLYKEGLGGIEYVRDRFNIPVVNYDLHYLFSFGYNNYFDIKYGRNGYGLERFDWYLMAQVSDKRFLLNCKNPYHIIGFDLKDGSLYPQSKKEFLALLDFPRKGFEKERIIQKAALKNAKVQYRELKRPLNIGEIRQIYRESSVFFLSFPESFGLPICEVQLCGCYVGSPYPKWTPGHFLPGESSEDFRVGRNFIIYENDESRLTEKMIEAKRTYDANQILKDFQEDYPIFDKGDNDALSDFIHQVETGRITYKTHMEHESVNRAYEENAKRGRSSS
ncbi:MAG TPA: hypothetical protein PKW59_13455 [Thermotogota bacterium]|nr:hypothetical protein [Thermotogota bacterium]